MLFDKWTLDCRAMVRQVAPMGTCKGPSVFLTENEYSLLASLPLVAIPGAPSSVLIPSISSVALCS